MHSAGFSALLAVLALTFAAPVSAQNPVDSAASVTASAVSAPSAPAAWPALGDYVGHFIASDGRVVDHDAGARSTSEGQAYALFFALVANDRPLFDRLLTWTRDNLAAGNLAKQLPAWLWGQSQSGKWETLDPNTASDADLWLAYTLLEAGRLWKDPHLERLGQAVLKQMAAQEVATLPHLGPTLLPGAHGFENAEKKSWRLNPSYLPLQVLRRIAALTPTDQPWRHVLHSAGLILRQGAMNGFIADWLAWNNKGAQIDDLSGPIGSYDAIRVYLWLGLLPAHDHELAGLQRLLAGPLEMWRTEERLPERVDTRKPLVQMPLMPTPLLAVLLPALQRDRDVQGLAKLQAQLDAHAHTQAGQTRHYYEQNLLLFATGALENRYAFLADGRLRVPWQ